MQLTSLLINLLKFSSVFLWIFLFGSCSSSSDNKMNTDTSRSKSSKVLLEANGIDASAGGGESYIIRTPSAVYFLDKIGGGLSSMIDKDSIDWLGFHNAPGSAHKGEYRGFPNAIHKQDGSYFHAMNAKTDPSTSTIEKETADHIRISFVTENKKWKGIWDFYPDRCDFTMSEISEGYHYWVQYEGVPGGEMDTTDFYYVSNDATKHSITTPFLGDLSAPEWMAFGDPNAPRVLYMLHHEDDEHPDNYVSRPDMTVLGFGRENKNKYINTKQTFSIGFVESTTYKDIEAVMNKIVKQYNNKDTSE